MKYFIYTIIFLAIALMAYNFTFLDFDNLLAADSAVAVVAIIASLCVIVLMVILLMSRTISKKYNK